ncbi:MAG TPA: flagellar basal body-associated FliL family protein [Solirubrobacteraceae bacterium]|jgi:flagellar FliL protein
MKKKLLIALPVLLIGLGGVYKLVLAKPAPAPKPKVDGEVYVLPRDFLINLSDGQFVKLNVALVLEHGALAPAGGEEAAAAPPEGFGALPQEAVVRDIVTNSLTGVSGGKLIRRKGREQLKRRILRQILKKTDVKAEDVLFTDVAVQ